MLKILFNSAILSMILYSCAKESQNLKELPDYCVQGYVLSESAPVQGAIVSLNDTSKSITISDDKGYFKLPKVYKGNYVLTAEKTYSDGSFSVKSDSIIVNENVTITQFSLPLAVKLFLPDSLGANSVTLKWKASDAKDFREYKIYQHTSSGLDETTGTLIHVSTSISDTEFTVNNLNPLTQYYFRVFVMNNYGKLGGSNIESAKTKNKELFINGSFENIDSKTGFALGWNLFIENKNFKIDSLVSQDGRFSIRIDDPPGVSNIINQLVDPKLLVANNRYKLSYWVKHDQLATGEYAIFINSDNLIFRVQVNTVSSPQPVSDWKLYEYEFTAPDIVASNYFFGFYYYGNVGTKLWIDNFSLIKVN